MKFEEQEKILKQLDGMGKLWEKGGNIRFYLDSDKALKEAIGLTIDRYKSGAISGAKINGEKISNNKAWKISCSAHGSYIDLVDCKVVSDNEEIIKFFSSKFNFK